LRGCGLDEFVSEGPVMGFCDEPTCP